MKMPHLTKKQRAYVYGVCAAALPLAVALGWMDPKMLPLVAGFLLALLNLSD